MREHVLQHLGRRKLFGTKAGLVGSHAGVSIGEDGPSQMALEDIASLRAIHSSAVLHPSDANQAAKLIAEMADRKGIAFLRTLRAKTEVRTPPARQSRSAAAGSSAGPTPTTSRSSPAASPCPRRSRRRRRSTARACGARVIDCYSIKPIDVETLRAAARDCGAIITVEDHWPEGGLGDAVLEALAEADDRPRVHKLAVREMPVSGSPEELLHAAEIDADAIADAARSLTAARA